MVADNAIVKSVLINEGRIVAVSDDRQPPSAGVVHSDGTL